MGFATKEQLRELVADIARKIKVPTIGLGGGFAPLGTINFFDAVAAPDGWLVCDGTIYNISDYPDLADWYEAQHGSKNFYGGNGLTTFAVPDLQGEFLRGAGTNSHENQGSGAGVGEHQDATAIPNTEAYAHSNFLTYEDGNGTSPINLEGTSVRQKTSYTSHASNGGGAASGDLYGNVRPTNTSYLICVKAVVSSSEENGSGNVDLSVIAPTEVSPSQHAYKKGQQLFYNGQLYTVEKDIAVGDVIPSKEGKRWKSKTWKPYISVDISATTIWTDGENMYYSASTGQQLVFDKEESIWKQKVWNYDDLSGLYFWTDGENIYYSKQTDHYVLNKATDTWEVKTWNGLTSFLGNSIWTDGENIYYSSNSNQYILNKATDTWEAKTWNGLTSFLGSKIWTDDENIYYSDGSNQYVLNKATDTWEAKTWNGLTSLTSFHGDNIWTDGENIYLNNYILNKATDTWEAKTWDEIESFVGKGVWTDGKNIYYSYNSDEYVLNKATDTWELTEWFMAFPIFIDGIWTDGENVYYSRGRREQYILNKNTGIWEPKTWNGYDNFAGLSEIWTDGEHIYCSASSRHYVLNKDTDTWEAKTWNGLTSFYGNSIWTDGENIYCSMSTSENQYVLNKATDTWEAKTWNGFGAINGYYVWTDGEHIYYSYRSDQYVLDKATDTWEAKTWNGLTSFNASNIWVDGEDIYLDHYILNKATNTWEPVTFDGLESEYVSGEGIWTDGENIYFSAVIYQFVLTDISNIELSPDLTSQISKAAKTGGGNHSGSTPAREYTAGDGINISNDEISIDPMPANDMGDIITPLPGVSGRRMRYSTEEQVVGTWIDGRPIYQKTCTGTLSNGSETVIFSGINKDNGVLIDVKGYVSNTDGGKYIIGYSYLNDRYIGVILASAGVRIDISGSSSAFSSLQGSPYAVTIQYTKTTDPVA